jgi:hypothetical protein
MTGGNIEEAQDAYKKVLDAIDVFIRNLNNAHIIVATRKRRCYIYWEQGYRLEGFTDLELPGFQPDEDAMNFIEHWFKEYPNPSPKVTAAELNRQLPKEIRLQVLAINPLFLLFMILHYQQQPENLAQHLVPLYEYCIGKLAKWNEGRTLSFLPKDTVRVPDQNGKLPIQPANLLEMKIQLLGAIAWDIHCGAKIAYSKQAIMDFVRRHVTNINILVQPDSKDELPDEIFLEEAVAIHGILKMHYEHHYGFLCLSMQEYFAAKHATHDEHARNEIIAKAQDDPWWGGVQLLYKAM